MTCRVVINQGVRAIVCSRRERTRRCRFCDNPAERLCDHPNPRGSGTCDAPLCDSCAVPGGDNVDYCPTHPPRLEGL
jgi:hypothetical protein